MSSNFVQSALLRNSAIGLFRVYAQAQFWRTGPRVLINSIPKSGTHLLMSFAEHTPGLMNAHLHLKRWSVYDLPPGADPESHAGLILNTANLESQLRKVRNGQVISSHLYFQAEANQLIQAEGFKVINLIRDPRDMLVSRLYYLLGLRRHYLHQHLVSGYADNKSRLKALIEGPAPGEDTVDGRFRPYRKMLEGFVGWVDAPGVLTLRYEDLVGERGGGSAQRQLEALQRFYDHIGMALDAPAIGAVISASQGRSTATLRKGQIGDWTNHFDDEIEASFQAALAPVPGMIGYA